MLPRSLTARLMLASLGGLLAAAIAAAAFVWLQFWPASPASMVRAELRGELGDIEEAFRVDAGGRTRVVLDHYDAATYDAMTKDAAYLVLNDAGDEVARSIDGPALAGLRAAPRGARALTLPGGDATVRLQIGERHATREGHRYLIRIARSERLVVTLNTFAGEKFLRGAMVTAGFALCTFALVVYFTIRRMVRPLRRASAVAARLEPGNMSERLRTAGVPNEIAPLIDAFNSALGRLERGFRVQQDFLASAAHELKTPLALLQAEIELGGAADKDALLRDTAQMARIVHQLLHLAEVSEGHNYRFEPVQLRTEIGEAVDYLQRLAAQRGVSLRLDGAASDNTVEADRGAVFVLAKNLLENALHHSPPGSTVHVRVEADGFWVQDQGRGVAPENIPHLFERFWRADKQNSDGAGLGLAICEEICRAHGWRIRYAGAGSDAGASGARFVVTTVTDGALD